MKKYRQNVAAIILNQENKIWLGERSDGLAWGFPQGGIEPDETAQDALYRELSEEIGTTNFDIVSQYPGTLKYDFPAGMTFPTWTYAGQEQHYFLVKLRPNTKIDLETHPEEIEFSKYKWCTVNEIRQMDFDFKNEAYNKALDFFEPYIKKLMEHQNSDFPDDYEGWMEEWEPIHSGVPFDNSEHNKIWNKIDEKFNFRPSTKNFPGFDLPKPYIKFDINDCYERTMVKDLENKAQQAFIECTKPGEWIYVLDWHHTGYKVDPRKPFPRHPNYRVNRGDELDDWVTDIQSDGDYHFFLAQDFSWGLMGHPWEHTISIFGQPFIKALMKQKPAMLTKIIEDFSTKQ